MGPLTSEEIHRAVQLALAEDIGSGDVTTLATIPDSAASRASMKAREPLVVAGLGLAEAAFREELRRHPKNPRALFGLAECLGAQGKTSEEASVRREFQDGWKHADIPLHREDL